MFDDEMLDHHSIDSIEFLEPPVNQLVVKPLLPSQIRWFYYKNEKKIWKPMSGLDSLNLENTFLQLTEENRQQAEPIAVRSGLYEVDVKQKSCKPVYWQCTSDETTVRRGLWFVVSGSYWTPLDEDLANEIETEHLKQFRNIRISAFSGSLENKKILHSFRAKDKCTRVDWFDITDVKMSTEKGFFNKTFGMGKGQIIQRGFHTEASVDEGVWNITQLCFVVHGIGQKMQEGQIIKTTKNFSKKARKYTAKSDNRDIQFLPVDWRSSLHLDSDVIDSITPHQLRGVRDTLNGTAMDIMYYNSPIYRAQIMQGLCIQLNRLYTMFCERNPEFGAGRGCVSIIAHSLGSVIAYDLMVGYEMEKESALEQCDSCNVKQRANTKSDSTITRQLIFSVKNYFIMGSPLPVFLTLRGIRPQPSGTIDHILPRSLCPRFFNIYHPADPVAYRIEPLILRHYSTCEPVIIQPYNSNCDCSSYEQVKRQPIRNKYKMTDMKSAQVKEVPSDPKVSHSGRLLTSQSDSNLADKSVGLDTEVAETGSINPNLTTRFSRFLNRRPSPAENASQTEIRSISPFGSGCDLALSVEDIDDEAIEAILEKDISRMPYCYQRSESPLCFQSQTERCDLDYPVDFQVKEKNYISILSALTAHFSYWKDEDVVKFIVDQIFHLIDKSE